MRTLSRLAILFGLALLPSIAAITASGQSTPSEAELMAAGPLGERALGDPDAPVTIIEYASMSCNHCARFHIETLRPFKEKYIDTGKVRFIFREMPLDTVAMAGFMVARCAPEERFFPIVDLLFEKQGEWAFADDPAGALLKIVGPAGFTEESYRTCLSNRDIFAGVNWVKDRAAGKFGVQGTPTFFINGRRHVGEMTLSEIEGVLPPSIRPSP